MRRRVQDRRSAPRARGHRPGSDQARARTPGGGGGLGRDDPDEIQAERAARAEILPGGSWPRSRRPSAEGGIFHTGAIAGSRAAAARLTQYRGASGSRRRTAARRARGPPRPGRPRALHARVSSTSAGPSRSPQADVHHRAHPRKLGDAAHRARRPVAHASTSSRQSRSAPRCTMHTGPAHDDGAGGKRGGVVAPMTIANWLRLEHGSYGRGRVARSPRTAPATARSCNHDPHATAGEESPPKSKSVSHRPARCRIARVRLRRSPIGGGSRSHGVVRHPNRRASAQVEVDGAARAKPAPDRQALVLVSPAGSLQLRRWRARNRLPRAT